MTVQSLVDICNKWGMDLSKTELYVIDPQYDWDELEVHIINHSDKPKLYCIPEMFEENNDISLDEIEIPD